MFEGPEIRLDHLRLEWDLSDPSVCLVEESAGGKSQDQSLMLKLLRKVHTFDNASSENKLPVRWLETSERTSGFWLVRGAPFTEFNCLVLVLEQAAGSWRKRASIEPASFTRQAYSFKRFCGIYHDLWELLRDSWALGKRTSFWSDIQVGGAYSQRFVGEQNVMIVGLLERLCSGFRHSCNDDRKDQNKRKDRKVEI